MSCHDKAFHRRLRCSAETSVDPEELALQYLPLVKTLARRLARTGPSADAEDLEQVGLLALLEAVSGFEDRGLGFASYAKLRVRGAIIDYLRGNSPLSRGALTFRHSVFETKQRLEQRFHRTPSEAEMAIEMGLEPARFRELYDQAMTGDTHSLDRDASDANEDFVARDALPYDICSKLQCEVRLREAQAQLSEREARVIRAYFYEDSGLAEIGKELEIGSARVCQIKKSALVKLKRAMQDFDLAA